MESARLPDGRAGSAAAVLGAASVTSVSSMGCGINMQGGAWKLGGPGQLAGADGNGVGVGAGAVGAPAGADGVRQPEAGVDEDQRGRQRSGAEPRAVQALVADLAAAQLRPAADAAALPDVVHHPGLRQAGDLPAKLAGPVAPVDFLVVHEIAGVERADLA